MKSIILSLLLVASRTEAMKLNSKSPDTDVEKIPDFLADGYSETWKYTNNPHYVNET